MFEKEIVQLNPKLSVHIISVKSMNQKLHDFLDNVFVTICEGHSGSSVKEAKTVVKYFFDTQSENIKGFDGYYSKDDNEWIMESKSGSILTDDNNHYDMLKKAYNDLKNKIAGTNGKEKNNPWKNAYNHASHIDVNSAKSLRDHIKALSRDYDQKIYYDIKDFKIIPSSTLFLANSWIDPDKLSLKQKIEAYFKNKKYSDIILLCVTKMSINILIDYIRET